MSLTSLFAAGILLASAPALPSRFADAGVYDVVVFDGGFDLAKTKGQAVRPCRGTNTACTAVVPCEQYVRAWVLCDVSADPKLDPAFAVRLTRHISKNGGRAFDSTALTTVEMKGKAGRQLVEVPLKTGEIEAIVFTDNRGDYDDPYVKRELARQKISKYLDLELIGRPIEVRRTPRDSRGRTDDAFTSGVVVHAVALEKPSAEMEHSWAEPGNVFHNDEKPETYVEVRVKRPGAHRLAWTIRDDEGKVLKAVSRPIAKSEKLTVDLSMPEVGWYGLDWKLYDGERLLLTHTASFALLGPDTRQTAQGEAPYGADAGIYANSLQLDGGKEEEQEIGAKLLMKLGMRRNAGSPLRRKIADMYKIGPASAASVRPRDGDNTNNLKRILDRYRTEWPNGEKTVFLSLGMPDIYRHAEEITGGVPDPANGASGAEKRVEGAKKVCAFIRKNYPDFKITVGNYHVPSEALAELMRGGFPKTDADFMGDQCMQGSNLPERLNGSSIQAVDCFRQLADRYGYPWGVNSGGWHCFRQDPVLGQDYQAWWYVRDLVLMQCWRFPDIFLAWNVDTGADYTDVVWGNSGLTRGVPYLYPKKGYVGLATATKVLDRVVSRRHVPTGDASVHVVEFAKKDGTYAYAAWAVNGSAELEIGTTGDFTLVDFYGRTRKPQDASFWNLLPFGGRYRLTVREQMAYLVAEKPVVASVKTLSRNYDRAFMARAPKDLKVVAETSDATQWELLGGQIDKVETKPGEFPGRRAGKGVMKQVADEEKGSVIEVSLPEPDLKLPKLVSEYTALKLKKPVPLKELPATLGVWVKGNAGMGEVYFILEDQFKSFHISSGGSYGKYDVCGLQEINFSGWKLVTFPVHDKSSVREYGGGADLNWTIANVPTWDYNLVGIVFCAPSRPLFLDEHRRMEQSVRLGPIVGFDYHKANE